jgi:cytochrome c peroxidase
VTAATPKTENEQYRVAAVPWAPAVIRLLLPDTLDRDLRRTVTEFNIRPLEVRRFEADPKFKLGQVLFFDPILSGPRNVSCATCHLLRYGTSDGLPQSIGVGGGALAWKIHER